MIITDILHNRNSGALGQECELEPDGKRAASHHAQHLGEGRRAEGRAGEIGNDSQHAARSHGQLLEHEMC